MKGPVTPRRLIRSALPPLLLSVLFTSAAYVATGPTAGLFFAGLVIATLLAPPLLLAEETRLAQLLCVAGMINGIGVVWLLAVARPLVGLFDWFQSYALLGAYVCALWGLATLLRRLRLRTLAASALLTTVFLAWLAWPVWLSPWIAGHDRLVGWLTPTHPLLALDFLFRALGPPWSERYYMYNHLSVLNQDVAYELPRSVLPTILLHGGIGMAGLLLGALILTRRAVRLEVDVPDGGGGGAGEQRVGEDLLP